MKTTPASPKARKAQKQDLDNHVREAPTPPRERTDTERLDWLISHGARVSHSRDGEVCNVMIADDSNEDSGWTPAEGYPQKCYYDPRAAIDAAMEGEK